MKDFIIPTINDYLSDSGFIKVISEWSTNLKENSQRLDDEYIEIVSNIMQHSWKEVFSILQIKHQNIE